MTDDLKQSLGELKQTARELTAMNKELEEISHSILNTQAQTDRRVHNSGNMYVSDSEVIAKMFNGQKIYLDPRDLSVAPNIALDSVWEDDVTHAWLEQVEDQSTILDIGANFGYYGLIAAQKTDKRRSRVVLFEANPDLIPYISKSIKVNWLMEQAVVENLAVSDHEGKATFHVSKDYLASSSLHSAKHMDAYMHQKMEVKTSKRVEVGLTSIDYYCRQHTIKSVDLIKMDIEGYEDVAYRGMRQTVKNSPNLTLFVEFTRLSYQDPVMFYNSMMADFGYVYLINRDGKLLRQIDTSYAGVVGDIDDWIMLVFSKQSDLGHN